MISRRQFLVGVAGSAPIVLAACSKSGSTGSSPAPGSTVEQPGAGSIGGATSVVEASPTSTPPIAAPAATTTTTTTRVAGGPAIFVDHGDPTSDMVALTFHLSGSSDTVTGLLDLLKERSVTVTAFAVGTWITDNPHLTKRVVADGHELANHTEHHLAMRTLSRQQISDEIVECGQAIMPFIGSIGRWFRPSATVVPAQVILDEAGKAGYPVSVGYDIDSEDNKNPGSAAIVANVNPKLHGGAIVSLHFGHPGTITALPHILDELAARKLRPVTVGTLLG